MGERPSMSTTTIRLEDDLKQRVAAAADRSGKTAHAFMLDAIANTVEQAETDERFQRLALARLGKVLKTGKTVPWAEAKSYLDQRMQGLPVRKPTARKAQP
jgi:predicted transcriptional regulator